MARKGSYRRKSHRHSRKHRGGSNAPNPSSYSSASSYGMAVNGTVDSQFNRVFGNGGNSNILTGVQGQNWIVTKGLQTGEKVIVDGIAKVKEGATVVAKPYQPQAAMPQGAGQPAADANKAGQPAAQAQPKTEQKATSNA